MITILSAQLWTAIAGTWALLITANQFINGFIRNTTAAQNDEISYPIFISAGTYKLSLIGVTASDMGITSVYIGTTLVATFDLYTAGTVYNVEFTQASIAIATSGAKTLSFKVASKNGASSAYKFSISSLTLVRTA